MSRRITRSQSRALSPSGDPSAPSSPLSPVPERPSRSSSSQDSHSPSQRPHSVSPSENGKIYSGSKSPRRPPLRYVNLGGSSLPSFPPLATGPAVNLNSVPSTNIPLVTSSNVTSLPPPSLPGPSTSTLLEPFSDSDIRAAHHRVRTVLNDAAAPTAGASHALHFAPPPASHAPPPSNSVAPCAPSPPRFSAAEKGKEKAPVRPPLDPDTVDRILESAVPLARAAAVHSLPPRPPAAVSAFSSSTRAPLIFSRPPRFGATPVNAPPTRRVRIASPPITRAPLRHSRSGGTFGDIPRPPSPLQRPSAPNPRYNQGLSSRELASEYMPSRFEEFPDHVSSRRPSSFYNAPPPARASPADDPHHRSFKPPSAAADRTYSHHASAGGSHHASTSGSHHAATASVPYRGRAHEDSPPSSSRLHAAAPPSPFPRDGRRPSRRRTRSHSEDLPISPPHPRERESGPRRPHRRTRSHSEDTLDMHTARYNVPAYAPAPSLRQPSSSRRPHDHDRRDYLDHADCSPAMPRRRRRPSHSDDCDGHCEPPRPRRRPRHCDSPRRHTSSRGTLRRAASDDFAPRRATSRRTRKGKLDPNLIVIPEKVIRTLRNGWWDYIPLDALSNAACRKAAFAPVRQNDGSITVSANGFNFRSSGFNCENELQMTREEWCQAARNFLLALQNHLVAYNEWDEDEADDIIDGFSAHFHDIQARSDFEANFMVYLMYDIQIRRQWLIVRGSDDPDEFDLMEFQEAVFMKLDRQHSTDLLASLAATTASLAKPAASNTFSGKSFPDSFAKSGDRTSSRKGESRGGRNGDRTKPYTVGRDRDSRAVICIPAPALEDILPEEVTEGGLALTAGLVATVSTDRLHVPEVIHVPTRITVPCAALALTVRNDVLRELHFPVSTPLKHARWTALLDETGGLPQFAEVPIGLRDGFSLGLEDFSLDHTFSPPNHYRSPEHHAFVIHKYAEEIRLGRVSPGYPPSLATQLFGFYRTAPLNVIESASGKLRITVDHSFPRNNPLVPSVNSVIDSARFQCSWGTFSICYLLVADAPPGTEACVFDVDAAFRNIPTHPLDRTATAISINGLIHLDGRLNFGICPAPGIFGLVADAIVWIYLHKGIDAVIKWVDDFIFFRYLRGHHSDGSPIFNYDESLIWSIAADLGWPWAPEKFSPFSTVFTYIGFQWSLASKTVCLPLIKREKYLKKMVPWSPRAPVSLRDTESLIGTLNHVTLVVPQGRSHMPALYRFRASFPPSAPPWLQHRVTPAVSAEIEWWTDTLRNSPCSLDIRRPPEPLDIPILVDASTSWGIGFLLNGKWLAWRLLPGWKADGRDIGWGEMVAVDLALRAIIAAGYSNCHLIVRSDNAGVVGALAAGRSRNSQQNAVLRQIVANFQCHNLWLTLAWIPTADNLADGPSRGVFPSRSLLFPHPPAIPGYLKPYVSPSVGYHDIPS
ncbi:hypothetical protein D9615_003233 [Tricholomella constricta]|uniref:Uncharacterized protein n=1 Tax=Tricholomella constricta TaxID=117010 RepID=A0A8H5M7Y1_9AGAR|nr:hypothetical protein D9615_003247 [Tricholomella constricta]KAF5384317.1 hypothetical protein D9615_003233 [Tricholomella constricta]